MLLQELLYSSASGKEGTININNNNNNYNINNGNINNGFVCNNGEMMINSHANSNELSSSLEPPKNNFIYYNNNNNIYPNPTLSQQQYNNNPLFNVANIAYQQSHLDMNNLENNNCIIPQQQQQNNHYSSPSGEISPNSGSKRKRDINNSNNILLCSNSSSMSTPSSPSNDLSPALSSSSSNSFNHGTAVKKSAEDYETLRDYWKQVKDISSDVIKFSKQGVKSDLQCIDLIPDLKLKIESFDKILNQMQKLSENLKFDERQQKMRSECEKNTEKREKRREATRLLNNVCLYCKTTDTPEWRKGPDGTKSLCNACGLHYAKNLKKEQGNIISFQPTESGKRMKVDSILNG